jgi:hypothetical protein
LPADAAPRPRCPYHRQRGERQQGQVVDDGPLGLSQLRQEGPALLMRTSRVPTSPAACWIIDTLVTSSARGVTSRARTVLRGYPSEKTTTYSYGSPRSPTSPRIGEACRVSFSRRHGGPSAPSFVGGSRKILPSCVCNPRPGRPCRRWPQDRHREEDPPRPLLIDGSRRPVGGAPGGRRRRRGDRRRAENELARSRVSGEVRARPAGDRCHVLRRLRIPER